MKQSAIIFLIFLFNATFLLGQGFELQMVPDSISNLDFNYRRIQINNIGQSTFSGTYELKYQHVFNSKINAIVDVGYNSYSFIGDSDSGLNNIYLGIQKKLATTTARKSALELGVYLPTSDNISAIISAAANYYDLPKYTNNDLGIKIAYLSSSKYNNGFLLSYSLGTAMLLGSDDLSGDEFELMTNYGISFGYQMSEFYVNSELLGILILTEDDSFNDNSVHSYSFGVGYNNGKINPRLFYKDYFDRDVTNIIDWVLGVSFGLNL